MYDNALRRHGTNIKHRQFYLLKSHEVFLFAPTSRVQRIFVDFIPKPLPSEDGASRIQANTLSACAASDGAGEPRRQQWRWQLLAIVEPVWRCPFPLFLIQRSLHPGEWFFASDPSPTQLFPTFLDQFHSVAVAPSADPRIFGIGLHAFSGHISFRRKMLALMTPELSICTPWTDHWSMFFMISDSKADSWGFVQYLKNELNLFTVFSLLNKCYKLLFTNTKVYWVVNLLPPALHLAYLSLELYCLCLFTFENLVKKPIKTQ